MTISRNSWSAYINKLSKINKTAAEKMQMFIDANGYDDIENLIYYAQGLTQYYGEAAAALACEMYEEIAAAQGVITTAVPAETYNEDYVAGTIRKLVNTSPVQIPNSVSRMVKQAGADTMLQNAERDGAEFAWIPHSDTCAFCITLASRGWQRISKRALKNGHAEHIHSNCDCEYAVRFDGKSNVAGFDPGKYQRIYYGADGNTPEEKINAMRRANYAENKDKINAQKRKIYAINTLENIKNKDIINVEQYLGKSILKTDNKSVREWYYANVHDIPNQIDKSKPLEEQARQAFDLRNKYKREARTAMSDVETANRLEKLRPVPDFEMLIEDKIKRKGLSREEALKDILDTASKTNADVDSEFGLGGDENV